MYEHKTDKLVPLPKFLKRMAASLLLVMVILLAALGLGVVGYHHLGGLSWIDSLLNASMILTGMGPVNPMTTDAAKFFASGYALFSGVVFLTTIGFVLAPIFHRILHKFQLDDTETDEETRP